MKTENGKLKKYKLGEYIDSFGDGIHGTPNYDEKGEYYFINGNNLKDGQLNITEDTLKISSNEYSKIKRRLIPNNTILVSINGTLGNVALYKSENIALGKSACYLNLKDSSFRFFLRYLLKTKEFKNYMNRVAGQSTIKNVSPTQISEYEFFAPPLESQQKIATVLSSLDDKIALNNRINAKLEQMAKRLYDYWFVQFDFPVSCHSELVSESHSEEMLNQVQHDERIKPYKSSGGKMEYNEVLKREIPVGWEVGILSDIANITMGQSPEGSSYNEDGKGTIFYQGSTDFGIRFPTVRMYTTEPTRFAKKGDILMSVRAPVGAVNIANTDCCIGRGLAALNSKIGSITYLWYLMDVFKHTFENKNAAGTTFGSITKDELFNLPVVIPQKEIIFAFNEKTFSIFNYQLSIEKETQKLTALRDRLLPLLMNGQVEVN